MVVAVAKAAEAGARAIVCASTGNTSASAAAYGAAAGLEVIVVLPKGQIAIGKLLQALIAGARVVAIDGNFDQALGIVRALAEQDDHPVTLVNSVNPFRLEGQKTAAFEICDDLGRAPDVLAIPVGNAGNISAYWAGFRDYAAAGIVGSTPRMWGFQAAGAAPLVVGHRIEHPETVATAIRIGDPASWTKAIEARDASGGRITAVTDDEILAAYRALARYEGIFCEPASAASVAGVTKAAAAGELDPDATVVCVLTGHGLKDPTTAERQVPPFLEAEPTRRLGRRRARLVGANDGRPLARRARWQPGHRRGARVVGQPRRGLRLPRRRPGDPEPDRARGPRLESRRDRADRRGRGPKRADRGPREPVRARSRGGAPSGPRRAARRASAGGSRCTTRSRSRAGSGRPRRRRSAGSWPATRSPASRCRTSEMLRLACEIEGHPDNAAAALLGGFVVSATDARRRRGDPLRFAARPARRAVHPGAPAADRRDARRAARRPSRWPMRSPTSARWRSAWPAWRPAATTCSPG